MRMPLAVVVLVSREELTITSVGGLVLMQHQVKQVITLAWQPQSERLPQIPVLRMMEIQEPLEVLVLEEEWTVVLVLAWVLVLLMVLLVLLVLLV